MKSFLLILLLTGFFTLPGAAAPEVPKEIRFADMTLHLTEGARKEIQTHVDALYRSPKYFQIKLERVDLYFPVIEKVLREENLPDDFKYLVIQESSLISDAVSSSNAVGFWQFKKPTAIEVGLRVDGSVDDRMHIVAATRGAATYLKRHNVFFDNWVYALLAYNMGMGGVQRQVEEKYFGKKKMEITRRTHWYIIKFLAHKIAFQNAIGKNTAPALVLTEYTGGVNQSLKEIADEMELDREMVSDYNKWLKKGKVPPGKVVLLPVPGGQSGPLLAQNDREQPVSVADRSSNRSLPDLRDYNSDKYPVIEGDYDPSGSTSTLVTVNGRPGIIAGVNVNLVGLAERGQVSLRKFLKYNDLESSDRAIPGQVYYFKRKRGKAMEHYHVVLEGETLWEISQKYGIRLKKLLRRNRIREPEPLKPGRVLWMRFIRPRDTPVEFKDVPGDNNAVATAGNAIPLTVKDDAGAQPPGPRKGSGDTTRPEPGENPVRPPRDRGENISKVSKPEETPALAEPTPGRDDEAAANTKEQEEFHVQEPVNFVEVPEDDVNTDKTMHRVVKGETLYGISRTYNVKIGDLLLWNNLKLGEGLQIGQKLYIANPQENQEPEELTIADKPPVTTQEFLYHEVQVGETMYKIAREYGVTIKEVMEWNMKKDFNVSVGEQLKIKKSVIN